MKIEAIARRLIELCRNAQWETAQRELYADDAVSIESQPSPVFPAETRGLDAIIAKGKTFDAMVEQLHAITVSEPLLAENSFACTMELDATMKGRGRGKMRELCIYDVKDGKIVAERFYA